MQKYKKDDILISKDGKSLIKIKDSYIDVEYNMYYSYGFVDLETQCAQRNTQSYLECKFYSEREINLEIHSKEKQVNAIVDEIDSLKWLKHDMYNKLKTLEKGEGKR